MNLQGILVRTFFCGFCLLLRGVELLFPSSGSATGLFTMSFFSLSMRSGSATPFLAFRRLFSTFSGLALPLPPFKKLSYSDTLLKHLTFGNGSETLGEYRARRGSNFSEHTSIFSASSPPEALSVGVSCSGPDRVLEQVVVDVSLLSGLILFLSPSSMFETTTERGIMGNLLSKLMLTFHSAPGSVSINMPVVTVPCHAFILFLRYFFHIFAWFTYLYCFYNFLKTHLCILILQPQRTPSHGQNFTSNWTKASVKRVSTTSVRFTIFGCSSSRARALALPYDGAETQAMFGTF